MTLSTSKRSRVTQPAVGENEISNSHFNAGSPFESRSSIPTQVRKGPPANLPCTSMVTSPSPRSSPAPTKHARRLPPRIPSHTALVALRGLPSRISLMVKPLPIPCSTRSTSRKFDLPLAFAPTNRFIRPRVRSIRRRLLKFSTMMRSIIDGYFTWLSAESPRELPAGSASAAGREGWIAPRAVRRYGRADGAARRQGSCAAPSA